MILYEEDSDHLRLAIDPAVHRASSGRAFRRSAIIVGLRPMSLRHRLRLRRPATTECSWDATDNGDIDLDTVTQKDVH
jgi:hypothetical protein